VSDYLAAVRGRRKAVLLLSEGVDFPMTDMSGHDNSNEVTHLLQEAVTAAARANVNFFTIDPRGLVGITEEFIAMAGTGVAGGLSGAGANNNPLATPDQLLTELRMSEDTLRTIAEQTGGFATLNTNSMTTAFERIVQANSKYYVLGYAPPSHPRDGRFHKIEVRMKQPGLKVSARQGYASPARGKTPEQQKRDEEARLAREARKGGTDATSQPLRDALNYPMEEAGLEFSVQAAPFRGAAAKEASVAMALEIDGSKLQFVQQPDGLFADKVEVAFFSLNAQGKAQSGTRSVLNLTLRPETLQRVKAGGMRANQRISLAPGRYQLRIGAREEASKRVGSVFYDLQVPDFSKDPLMLSGLLLSSPSTDQTPTAQKDPMVEKLLPGPPTSRREFLRTDTIALAAEICDNSSSRQPRQIDTTVRLLAESGQDAFVAHDSLTNGGDTNKWDTYVFTKQVPLQNVAPGRYLLRVEAAVRGNQNGAKPVAHETLVTVH